MTEEKHHSVHSFDPYLTSVDQAMKIKKQNNAGVREALHCCSGAEDTSAAGSKIKARAIRKIRRKRKTPTKILRPPPINLQQTAPLFLKDKGVSLSPSFPEVSS